MIRAVLFDLDGLMVDSEPHSIVSWQAVLGRHGVAFDQTMLDSILGLRLSETAQLAIDRFHLPDQPAELAREKTEYQIEHLNGNVKPMSGLIELLDDIDRRGLRKAIASSGMRRYVMAVLKTVGLTDRFNVIVTGDDVIKGKPAPDVFLKAAEVLRIEPQACLVLEDAPAGVQAAKAAGMMCIAVPNEHTRQLDLSLADEVLPSLSVVRDRLPALV